MKTDIDTTQSALAVVQQQACSVSSFGRGAWKNGEMVRGLSRVDSCHNGWKPGWCVRAHGVRRFFQDDKHGGRLEARCKAVECIQDIIAERGPVTGGRRAAPKVAHLPNRMAYRAHRNFDHPKHGKKRLQYTFGYAKGRTAEWARDQAQRMVDVMAQMNHEQTVRVWETKLKTSGLVASATDIIGRWSAVETMRDSQRERNIKRPWHE